MNIHYIGGPADGFSSTWSSMPEEGKEVTFPTEDGDAIYVFRDGNFHFTGRYVKG